MSPTGQDRERAAATLNYGPDEQVSPMDAEYVAAIAAALADERDRARAPFLALAEELERESEHSGPAKGAAYRIAADRIRRAVEDSQ